MPLISLYQHATTSFMPHGYCYLWQPGILGLHVVADSIITISYYSIPVGLAWFVSKRRDVPFGWIIWLFAIFIAGCGTTHLMEIWTVWRPDYWFAGVVKGVTAVASVGTAIALVPLIPKVIALPTPAQLEAKNAELAIALRELEGFSYSVSHDLRAPLRAIDGFSKALLVEHGASLKPEGQRMLAVVRENAQQMDQLIRDILSFARLARTAVARTPVDMDALARTIADELSRLEGAPADAIRIEPLEDAVGDQAMLRQVWSNLVGNGLKFSRGRASPRVTVSSRVENGMVSYQVRDNGVGFDMQYADKLFGVFQRLHHVDEFEGTGVGLAIVQRIVHRHGGDVRGEGRPGEGATFTFTLPRRA
jgi:signal transduction histidine kinase